MCAPCVQLYTTIQHIVFPVTHLFLFSTFFCGLFIYLHKNIFMTIVYSGLSQEACVLYGFSLTVVCESECARHPEATMSLR